MPNTLRTVALPPATEPLPDGVKPGGWWHDVDEAGRMICDLCPRACNLKPGDRGFCFVRQNRDGQMVLTTYGRSTGFCIDPIEKKPLNHFYPGTSVLSFGTAGCNLGCKFCQNHDISKARKVELLSERATPVTIARAARELGCHSVAFTYNDPVIWAEYAIDTARECRQAGLKSVAVTAGYITPQARGPFFEFFDAANVDLKGFTEDFYEHLTLSHLQPVLDTLKWLKDETDVWIEITNLVIPDANDSSDELRRLCDWLLAQVGDEVPLHFTAFHPDFKMLDRPRTPHETLLAAHQIARQTGLKYVYVGNVNDQEHQSTFCRGCGKLVIERDWYELGAYHLDGNKCAHCGEVIAGHFAGRPGDWGRKRLPVQIGRYAEADNATTKEVSAAAREGGTVVSNPQTRRSAALDTFQFTSFQRDAIHRAACEFVAAAVTGRPGQLEDRTLGGLADRPVMGVYISLKRRGRLRGCCGFTGEAMPLISGLQYSARRTAHDDIRLPPISPTELAYLELEVWLLHGLIPVEAQREERAREIVIGRDGLLISRGNQRGLLLPGVATDHGYDAEAFLRQVCLKAKLPPTAWRESDTHLQRFEGVSVKAPFDASVMERTARQAAYVVGEEESLHKLADFCRRNVSLIMQGAVPNYYLAEVSDGMVKGAVLTARRREGTLFHVPRISLRPPIPLQTTLYSLSESMAKLIQRARLNADDLAIDLTTFEDSAMHGTTQEPDLRGFDPTSRALLLMRGAATAWRFDPSQAAPELLGQLTDALQLRFDQFASIFSFHVRSTHAPLQVVHAPRPTTGEPVRPPAVAGKFYPRDAAELQHMVDSMVPTEPPVKKPWRAALVPHAGLPFSGRIAAHVLAHIEIPDTVIIIGPKHTRYGVDWAVAPHATWSLPGMEVASDLGLVDQLCTSIAHLEKDAQAHQAEHAIEVELPFLHRFAPQAQVVGIALGGGELESCRDFAQGLSDVLRARHDHVLLLISSDMNHYASDPENRRLDEIAMRAIETLDPEKILQTVREHEISMCGVLPAVIVMETLHRLQPLTQARRVAYATSADVSGDTSRVVGYAGMLFE